MTVLQLRNELNNLMEENQSLENEEIYYWQDYNLLLVEMVGLEFDLYLKGSRHVVIQ